MLEYIFTVSPLFELGGGAVADPGGRGSGPPFWARCRVFNIGPKVGPPPLFACRPKMDPSGGSRVCVCDRGDHPAPPWNVGVLVNVQEWGCFSNFLRADDVTRTMSKGGGACECPRVGVFFKFSEGG